MIEESANDFFGGIIKQMRKVIKNGQRSDYETILMISMIIIIIIIFDNETIIVSKSIN